MGSGVLPLNGCAEYRLRQPHGGRPGRPRPGDGRDGGAPPRALSASTHEEAAEIAATVARLARSDGQYNTGATIGVERGVTA
ncbi:hypothetical protein [Streptomyces sp. NPDC014734]|uniref:hypothetical protein n=1 Tax=Streptomyces sp. NPDC014734 TaxID=3364886 RepID=UPI0036FD5A06